MHFPASFAETCKYYLHKHINYTKNKRGQKEHIARETPATSNRGKRKRKRKDFEAAVTQQETQALEQQLQKRECFFTKNSDTQKPKQSVETKY